MKKALYIVFISISVFANAQEISRYAFTATGGSFSSANFNIEYAVGEVFTGSFSSGNFTIISGVVQPELSPVSNVENTIQISDNVKMYPNPVVNNLFIEFEEFDAQKLVIRVIDITGKIRIDQENDLENQFELISVDCTGLYEGVYFVTLYADNKLLKRVKVYKK